MRSLSFMSHGFRFLGEQDGGPERDLKEALLPVLGRDRQVERAYLARIHLAEADAPSVAMAIVRKGGASKELNDGIAAVFHSLFSSKNFLDVIFVTTLEEKELAAVCAPFYVREARSDSWFKRLFS